MSGAARTPYYPGANSIPTAMSVAILDQIDPGLLPPPGAPSVFSGAYPNSMGCYYYGGSTPLSTNGSGNINQDGTGASFASANFLGHSGYIQMQTGTTSGQYARFKSGASNDNIFSSTPSTFYLQQILQYSTEIAVIDTANVRLFAGIQDTAADTMVSSDTPQRVIGFRYSTAASDTNWQCYTSTTGGQNVVDSGVAVAANTRYSLAIKIVVPDSATAAILAGTYTTGNASSSAYATVYFYINGVLVATVQAYVPTGWGFGSTGELQARSPSVTTLTSAAKKLWFKNCYLAFN